PLSFDGDGGVDSLIVKGTADADSFTVTGSQVQLPGAGTLTYLNTFESLTVDGLGGDDMATATFTSGFSGSLTLVNTESATLSVPGAVTAGSSITGTNFSNVSIGTLAGTLLASGGSITGATITNVASTGLLKATETPSGSAGVFSNAVIGSVAG